MALGNNELEMRCLYNPETVTNIYSIVWSRKPSGDQTAAYQTLVTYFTPGAGEPVLSQAGGEITKIKSRMNITAKPEVNSLEASFKLTSIECNDETSYRCLVSFFNPATAIADSQMGETTVTVTGNVISHTRLYSNSFHL